MNIRDAILKAADHIEANPQEFRFIEHRIPKTAGCGTPGCALGWIGHYMGVVNKLHIGANTFQGISEIHVAPLLVAASSWDGSKNLFYKRMDAACGHNGWRYSATECARALRLYADEYHPACDDSRTLTNWSACAWRPNGVRA